MLLFLAVRSHSVSLFEKEDDVRSFGQIFLDVVGPEELEVGGPLFAHSFIVVGLLVPIVLVGEQFSRIVANFDSCVVDINSDDRKL